MLYLIWRGQPKGLILEKLKILPPSLLNNDDASRYKYYRERLRQDLLSAGDAKVQEPH
jgi:hypothetical protein